MVTSFKNLIRLFDLIQNAPVDVQVSLVKHIYKGRLDHCLRKAVLDLSHEEQLSLLNHLEESVAIEPPETTLDLDERQAPRKKCHLPLSYSSDDQTLEVNALDISTLGVFIETLEPLAVGQQLVLRFTIPANGKTIEATGRIIWKGPRGVGVQFVALDPDIMDLIRRYIDQI